MALRLLIRKDGADVREVSIDGLAAWVGRDAGCEVRLEDLLVSRKHAELQVVEGGLEVYNRSEFGVISVNGRETQRAVLAQGDRIGIGPFEVRVVEVSGAATAGASDASASSSRAPGEFAPLTGSVPRDFAPITPEAELEAPAPEASQASGEGSSGSGSSEDPSLEDFLSPELKENSDSGADSSQSGQPVENSQGVQGGVGADVQREATFASTPSAAPELEPAAPVAAEETTNSANTRVLSNRRIDVRLVFPPGAANVAEYFIRKQKVVLGRGSDCDVILTTKKASRHHAIIERRGMLFSIRDLGSANGLLVNGIQVAEKDLAADDRIQIGEYEFSFVANSDSAGIPTSPSIMQERTQSGLTNFSQPQAAGLPADLVANLPPPLTGQILRPEPKTPDTPAKVWIAKFKALPMRKRVIYIAFVLATLFFMFEEEEVPVRTGKRGVAGKSAQTDIKKRTAADLTSEQRKYVDQQYSVALDSFQNRDYDQTLLALQKVFELLPDYKDARDYERYAQEGKRAREEITERKRKEEEEAQLKRRVAQLTEEISGLMQRKEYEVAEQLFAEIQSVDPENAQVKTWQAEITAARELEKQLAEEARIREEIDRKAGQILAQGKVKLQGGRYLAAIEAFQEVPKTGSSNTRILKEAREGIREAKKSLDVRINPILELAKEAQNRGDLVEAFKQYRAVLKIDPTNAVARNATRAMRSTLHERGKILYTEGVLAESYSDFETARQRFEEVMLALPDDDVYYQRASRKLGKLDKFMTSKERI